MKILFFDVETTGLKYNEHGIHQLSGEININGETKEVFNLKVRPRDGCAISDEALAVGKVTREQIFGYPNMRDVYREFIDMLSKYVDKYSKVDKFHLCGYNNASFDNNFLRAWFYHCGETKYFNSWFWIDTIDVMVLASSALAHKRAEMPNFKLSTVCEELGIRVEEGSLHDASYDIELTKQLFFKLTGFRQIK